MKRTSPRGHHPPPAHGDTVVRGVRDDHLGLHRRRTEQPGLAGARRPSCRCVCCGRFAADLRRSIVLCRAAGATILPAAVRRRARARIAELLQTMTPARARDRGSRTVAPRAVRSPRARRQR